MSRHFVGVRWWLGAAFAVVAATSTAIVVSQFSSRSEDAFRSKAEEAVLSAATAASRGLDARTTTGRALIRAAAREQLSLRLYRPGGELVASSNPGASRPRAPRLEQRALSGALGGRTYAAGTGDGNLFVAGVPVPGGALVALRARPDVAAAIGTVTALLNSPFVLT